MAEVLVSRMYTYIHDDHKTPLQSIDKHHIFVRKSKARNFLVFLSVVLLLAHTCHLFMMKGLLGIHLLRNILLGALVRSVYRNSIEKESVMVMPTFGVQLETHYRSGRIKHRFVPIGKILKPVLNECVTPVTCFWSLALLVHGEAELMLVFQEMRPPLKMLIPVWKALCTAADCKAPPVTQLDLAR